MSPMHHGGFVSTLFLEVVVVAFYRQLHVDVQLHVCATVQLLI
jgi:hypothetical protein